MLIRFSRPKGTPVLTCVRGDGSSTYSKSAHGDFFGPHDLMHYAVETTLGLREGFFGLIAAGWTIEQFAERGAAARLPAEALLAEQIVNLLLQEATFGPAGDAEALNDMLRRVVGPQVRAVTDGELATIRERFAKSLAEFRALGPGETLDREFTVG